LEANSYNHSKSSAMSTFKQSVIIYRRPERDLIYREFTTNIALTIAMLEAQGCIIIDIIDL